MGLEKTLAQTRKKLNYGQSSLSNNPTNTIVKFNVDYSIFCYMKFKLANSMSLRFTI